MEARAVTWVYGHYKKICFFWGQWMTALRIGHFLNFCWKSLKLEQGIFVCYLNCDFPFQPNSRDPLGKPVSTP